MTGQGTGHRLRPSLAEGAVRCGRGARGCGMSRWQSLRAAGRYLRLRLMAGSGTGPQTFGGYTLATCPDRAKHTPCPSGYVAWHEWAEKKAKTHTQERCPTCLLWAIWKPKRKEKADA